MGTLNLLKWLIGMLLYAIFWRWYTSSRKPLTPSEIEQYMEKLSQADLDTAVLSRFRHFMETDSGRDFVMVNLLQMKDDPEAIQALNRYSISFLGKLIPKAVHPVFAGDAVSDVVEMWGVQDAEQWSSAGLIRYRSRRDLMDAAIDPNTHKVHPDKVKALAKTIAVPVEPTVNIGDPRLIVALLMLAILALFTSKTHS